MKPSVLDGGVCRKRATKAVQNDGGLYLSAQEPSARQLSPCLIGDLYLEKGEGERTVRVSVWPPWRPIERQEVVLMGMFVFSQGKRSNSWLGWFTSHFDASFFLLDREFAPPPPLLTVNLTQNNQLLIALYRKNPNGCGIRATFFVNHEYSNYAQIQWFASQGHEIGVHSIT